MHVTDFTCDPFDIPADRRFAAWAGDFFSRYTFEPTSNQYFTISNFFTDDEGTARRRKSLFRFTPCIVLDDVKEKLSMTEVNKLPKPQWILETSPGSEQWGYILDAPCTDRGRVENLLDGLVANGLAPDGRDPGMKGVTRYVRLPDGYNLKQKKMVNGQPFKCRMLQWVPFTRVTLEELAAPFAVDLNAQRREQRVDGASDVADHPILNLPTVIEVKEVRSAGRFDIRCPWVDEHTGADDSGAAVFTNEDYTIGFKCHHGACQGRTGNDLLRFIEENKPGFGSTFTSWKALKVLNALGVQTIAPAPVEPVSFIGEPVVTPAIVEPVSFIGDVVATIPQSVSITAPVAPPPVSDPVASTDGLQLMLDQLKREHPTSETAKNIASELLKLTDEMRELDKMKWHDLVRDVMAWSKSDLVRIVKDLRKSWYKGGVRDQDFMLSMIFIREQNRFYDYKARMFYTTEAFQNSFADEDAEAKKTALQMGQVMKVDKLDYAPKMPRVFSQGYITYGNSWSDDDQPAGVSGDAEFWLNHWDVLGWGDAKKHMLQFMAFTLLHPDQKINHMLILGSGEGGGKDYLLYPLIMAMGDNSTTIEGHDLLSDFNDYLLGTKYLHINETELGDRKEALAIGAKLKPIAAAPPTTLRINIKGVSAVKVRNIVNGTMTTNSKLPIRLNGPSRRFYPVWSDVNTRGADGQTTPEWSAYWEHRWWWMIHGGGAEACIWYLRNCVDLSDFKPGAAPPVTEFLKEMQEASKSPVQQTIDSFIEAKIGLFECDLIMISDMVSTIRAGELSAPQLMQMDSRYVTNGKLSAAIRDLSCHFPVRAFKYGEDKRLWVIRNHEKYRVMSGSELYDEYMGQMQDVRTKTGLSLVS